MDPSVQLVCVLIGATAGIVSIISNGIKIGEFVGPRIKGIFKKFAEVGSALPTRNGVDEKVMYFVHGCYPPGSFPALTLLPGNHDLDAPVLFKKLH